MSEVVTKRLLTDETGQLLVTALNSIAASCKPDATEINMGPNDDTKVATQINSLSEQIANAINDFGSKTIAGMNTAIEGKLSSMSVGESVSFKVTLTDTDSVFTTSGAHTGIATKSADSRINATLIRSGTSTIGYYCGTKTSNGWVWQQIAAGTEFNTVAISTLADLQTYLDAMPAGKTSTLLLSGAASNAVCGSTYTCNVTVSKVDNNFADLRWSRSNADVGFARYQKTSQTFLVEHIPTNSEAAIKFAELNVSSGNPQTVQIESGGVYLITCVHPYSSPVVAIVYGWTAGAGRLAFLMTSTNTTVTIDSSRNVTITSSENLVCTFTRLNKI